MKLNFIKVKNRMLKWKEVEQSLGMTFIRYKQRKIRALGKISA